MTIEKAIDDLQKAQGEEYGMAIEALRFQKELLMCKDCMESDSAGQYCYAWANFTREDGYCHLGKRRDVK